jgi:hypothetical protein
MDSTKNTNQPKENQTTTSTPLVPPIPVPPPPKEFINPPPQPANTPATTTANTKPVYTGEPSKSAVSQTEKSFFQPPQMMPFEKEKETEKIKPTITAKPSFNTANFTQPTSPDYHVPKEYSKPQKTISKFPVMYITITLIVIILGFGGSFLYYFLAQNIMKNPAIGESKVQYAK